MLVGLMVWDAHMKLLARSLGAMSLCVCALIATLAAQETDEADAPAPAVVRFAGMCDASAGVAISERQFLVADDERNVILAYDLDQPAAPLAEWNWSEHLAGEPGKKVDEADVEGATRIGDTVYWIASHGRNLHGKWRPSRHQFFATKLIQQDDGSWDLQPVGQAFSRLATRLVQEPKFGSLELRDALGSWWNETEELAPKASGLSIEGLAADPDGQRLWIGFRNPLPDNRALLVPLLNAPRMLEHDEDPIFGDAVLLPFHVRWQGKDNDLAVRSIEYHPALHAYLIVAGRPNSQRVSALYSWSGSASDRPALLPGSKDVLLQQDFNPEALIVWPQRAEILLLSDDGTRRVPVAAAEECAKGAFDHGHCEQKFLLDHSRQTFGALRIPLSRLKP
ncbi:MAG: hypothetical protein KDB23_15700 [Planctomycetales bacterium]|nr:hypothetical protein [Planctomycetales bacterium]